MLVNLAIIEMTALDTKVQSLKPKVSSGRLEEIMKELTFLPSQKHGNWLLRFLLDG